MACAADRQHRETEQLDARVHQKVSATEMDHAVDVFEVFVGLFHADDVATVSGQPRDGVRLQVHGGAARDVVDEDGKIHGSDNAVEVAVQTFLGRANVVGNHEQSPVSSDTACNLAEPQRFSGMGAGASC